MNLNEHNLIYFDVFYNLKATVDRDKAQAYFERIENKTLIRPVVNRKIDQILKEFILSGGFELE